MDYQEHDPEQLDLFIRMENPPTARWVILLLCTGGIGAAMLGWLLAIVTMGK